MSRTFVLIAAVFALFASPLAARAQTPYIFQYPTLSRTQIAFEWGGDIWTVARTGGRAQRLVTGFNLEGAPYFSPDGSMIAFSGNYDGNIDVYVVPANGGEPRRLTFHPTADVAVGWTPDGKDVLFRSGRASYADENQLYTVPAHGGFPKALPLAMAEEGSYSPDASHLAYVPTTQWEPQWQHYRGGQTTPIWIANLADSSVVKIPRPNSNDRNPMWVGNTVYFLSDRDAPATLYGYDTATRAVHRLLPSDGFDILSANAGPGGIVYTQLGSLHLYDTANGSSHAVPVTMAADMPQLRPHWLKVEDQIQNAAISPSGVRAVFEAHGDIFTVPAQHGDIRNLTQTPAVADRDPSWSPDGRWIAHFSDRSGEYALHIKDQRGLKPARVITLPTPSFFYSPLWSPDSKKIAYSDKHGNLWYIDVSGEHAAPQHVATAPYETFGVAAFTPAWSPDSRWIAYSNQLANFLNAIFVYSLDDRRSTQITDGMSDSRNPAFDKSGKYLYFLASTNTGLTANGLDMTSDQHPTSSNLYAAVLQEQTVTPIKPETGDEPETPESAPPSPSPAGHGKPAPARPQEHGVHIDFDGMLQRIVALPVPNANYVDLAAGAPGEVYLVQAPLTSVSPQQPPMNVLKFDMRSRRVLPLAQGISNFALSFNGKAMLLQQGPHWIIASTAAPLKGDEPALKTGDMELWSVPREEWAQMYHETWRIERDFFYDKHFGGLNIAQTERRFAAFLPGLGSRDDLSVLMRQMLSYLSTGHMFVRGGTEPPTGHVTTGLLGADYTIDHDRYRFAKIYNGENWNPQLMAPLTQPGETVHAGEYLLAVNGHPLHAGDNIYQAFEETAGKQTIITVSANSDGGGARNVTVTPLANEHALRNYAWIEQNRREVDRLSGGKLGYVYLPDTQYGGFTNFNRYFFSQVDKQGVILDERFNHGGQIADYIIDILSRKPMSMLVPRDGKRSLDPPLAIYGPKVMIINQYAGSGGDAMPWYFRKAHIGPLVGVRTWGGLVGIGGYPALMDGGSVTAPRIAIAGLHGHWEVEGHGIPPDVEVWQDPKLMRDGHDPQLEAAVDTAMRMLREHPLPQFAPPPYPNHHEVLPH